MTDKLFKCQNIQLIPTNTRATRQNTILPTKATAEEQFAAIEASTHQHILNDIRQQQQPTAPDQSPDVLSSLLEDKGPTNEVETTVTTSASSFEIVQHDDNEQEVHTVPPILRGARSQTSNSWSFIYFTLIFHSELKINLDVHSS